MKLIKKKILVVLIACLMLGMTFSIPVLAATNSVSKSIRLTTYKKTSFSSGSLAGDDIQVTQVKIYINSFIEPEGSFGVYIESPSGTVAELIPSTKPGTYYINSFNGENPKGMWYAWIETKETASIENITVNATMTVTYSY
ncbi:MAG: hypothetical protein HDR22_11965 [Lachnospiraceae bacterium]|nr:hypothetical protein [Lachnospiraceae bacterium]